MVLTWTTSYSPWGVLAPKFGRKHYELDLKVGICITSSNESMFGASQLHVDVGMHKGDPEVSWGSDSNCSATTLPV